MLINSFSVFIYANHANFAKYVNVERIQNWLTFYCINPFNTQYPEWYEPNPDLDHTIKVCNDESGEIERTI